MFKTVSGTTSLLSCFEHLWRHLLSTMKTDNEKLYVILFYFFDNNPKSASKRTSESVCVTSQITPAQLGANQKRGQWLFVVKNKSYVIILPARRCFALRMNELRGKKGKKWLGKGRGALVASFETFHFNGNYLLTLGYLCLTLLYVTILWSSESSTLITDTK